MMLELCPKCGQYSVYYDRIYEVSLCRNFYCDYVKTADEEDLTVCGGVLEEEESKKRLARGASP